MAQQLRPDYQSADRPPRLGFVAPQRGSGRDAERKEQ
jgi:hypothetical protein